MPGNALASGAGAAMPAPHLVHGLPHLPPHLLAALVPLLVLILALDVYCLVDLARAKSVKAGVPKLVWVVVILFVSAPIGALAYLFFGRDRDRGREAGPGGAAPVPAGAPAPGWPGQAGEPGPPERAPGHDAGPSAGPGGAIVTTVGLTRDYGGTGLFAVDLLVPRGCVYGLVGLNGSGKTTLLSLLSGTRRPDRGTVSLGVARRRIAVCPDVCEFDGWLTAYEVVGLARSLVAPAAGVEASARAAGGEAVAWAADGDAVAAALRTAGLADSVTRRVGGFSRGMTQRLGLACALVGDPELLILDEPTSALDPAGRAEVLGLVAAMRGHRTVIFSSHILADVQRIADQVGILRDGRLIYQGATQDLVDTYLSPSWIVRIAGDAAPVAAALTGQPWVTRVEPAGTGAIQVDATSIEAGERGIPAAIAACGARQVSCEPAAADLESAFLALTGARAATGSAR